MTLPKNKNKAHAWVVSVDMGYGHQRAAYPLRHIAHNGILNANTYPGIPHEDRKIWKTTRRFYEFISRFKQVPLIGNEIFELYDTVQSIPAFYPKRDLSEPTFQVKQVMSLIRKSHWGEHLIAKLAKKPLPLICTFFAPAFMAEYYQYPGDIYCLATDTDISRAWVPQYPARSRIKYFAPTYRVADRLRLYGVRQHNIFLTGFPLPIENTGPPDLQRLKRDILYRLVNLDPKRRYVVRHSEEIHEHLGYRQLPRHAMHPLMLTFAVGGAGAQRDTAVMVLRSLRQRIVQHQISYTMVAGIHNEVSKYFRDAVRDLGLLGELGKHIHIIFANSKNEYFAKFNEALRTTDILWSKPSELSFYTALGIPLIIAPPIGSQERFNRKWVESIGSGGFQEDPEYAHEWLFDWIRSGWLAEAAIQGFVEAPKFGTFNIAKIISEKPSEMKAMGTVLPY
ncbi:MAG: hypothetical protein HY422_00935 [Candidatus Komeilibacteria bacterium]|nr:hypothetical protein [Candidatus Komeilibacteria bacterium]